jgi:hypothetical protein
MTDGILTQRELNRALLARQLLLQRSEGSPHEVVSRLVGMQMQDVAPPYVGLWSRLSRFEAADVQGAFLERSMVRATMMRATIHLMTTADFLALRGAIQPALDLAVRSVTRGAAASWDVPAMQERLRPALAGRQVTAAELRELVGAAFPEHDLRPLTYAVRMSLPLVRVPDGGRWGFTNDAPFTLAEDWLGRSAIAEADPAELVRRYLAAFGPATVADFQTWSGMQGAKPLFEQLRPELRVFRPESGMGRAELFDVPEAPLPPAETPAPPRFLPAFDNVLLAHKDRYRIIAEEHRPRIFLSKNLRVEPVYLLDGEAAGLWRIEVKRRQAALTLEPFDPTVPVDAEDERALRDEAERLVRFVEPDATSHEVRMRQ